jgi:hypothetical protein
VETEYREASIYAPRYACPKGKLVHLPRGDAQGFSKHHNASLKATTPFLPTPPSHPSNPLNPPLNTLPFLDILLHAPHLYQFNRIEVLSQLLIPSQSMHKTMTSPAQPCHTIQLILCMPPPLPHARMRRFRDKMVVCQRYPVSAAEFTRRGARAAPYRRWCSDSRDVRCEEWSE